MLFSVMGDQVVPLKDYQINRSERMDLKNFIVEVSIVQFTRNFRRFIFLALHVL